MREAFLPKFTKYIPWVPTAKQLAFLWLDCRDAFYGGAAGGGKSAALLMAALQYVDQPDYDALLIRNTYKQLSKPKALLDLSHAWLSNTDAHWNGDLKQWRFPAGATLGFSYLDGPMDHFNEQGAAYHFVGIDELTQIRENQALYVAFSRSRKSDESKVPIRFRSTSNPPAAEQVARGKWVKTRYVDPKTRRKGRIFIPADLNDNPYLDKEDYVESLSELDPVTRAQLLSGDWDISAKGRKFSAEWFKVTDAPPDPSEIDKIVRFWDRASTEPSKENKDPDWTVGVKMILTKQGLKYVINTKRFRESSLTNEKKIKNTADLDGIETKQRMEQEPGSSGKDVIDYYGRRILSGYDFKGVLATGSQYSRSDAYASAAERGEVYLLNGYWVDDFLEEHEIYPDGEHDDQVVSAAGAYNELCGVGSKGTVRMARVG
jgi:predicted phage terminase large subunit-like protein